MDEEEYEEMKKDTIDQLKEFSESLNKMKEGNMTLVDDISRWQLVGVLSSRGLSSMTCMEWSFP